MHTLTQLRKDKVNAIIIHSNELLAKGIQNIFEDDDRFHLIFTEKNIAAFAESLKEGYKIDVLLLDITLLLKEQSIFHKMQDKLPTTIVMLSGKQHYFAAHEAVVAGARGYILEDTHTDAFKKAIKHTMEGYNYFHPLVVNELLENHPFKTTNSTLTLAPHQTDVNHPFTKREMETLKLIAQGRDNEDISELLNISERTVRNHVASIFKKIHVNSRTQAIILSSRNGWIDI